MAGNIRKAVLNSPFKIKNKARCVPHPKHSTPNNFLFKHGNIYFSISKMINFICNFTINIQNNTTFERKFYDQKTINPNDDFGNNCCFMGTE
jgi:hypothetical protein